MTTLRAANQDDYDTLLEFARAFAQEDGHEFSDRQPQALRQLLDDPTLGRLLIIEERGGTIGYMALCFGYSLEFGGRDGFVDELYIVPDQRDRGHASRALDLLNVVAAEAGLCALHLEVMEGNPAIELYRRQGYQVRDSRLMSKFISRDRS